MKNWISKNYKLLIIGAFLVPIFTVALVSISHVTKWYGISNPVSWAIYLSIGIEIAALSTLAAISADMGKKVYFPFGLVTLVQFIGNIYFAYSFIDIDSKSFKDWIDLVSPMVEFMGVDNTDLIGHKRFLAFFAGGMLPIISLSFLHMLVKFTEEDRKKTQSIEPVVDIEKISRDAAILEAEKERKEKYTPTEEELEKIEEILNKKYGNNQKFEHSDVNENNVYHNEYREYNEGDEIVPTPEEEEQNFSTIDQKNDMDVEKFSTIDQKNENIFQDNLDHVNNENTDHVNNENTDHVNNENNYESNQVNNVDEKKKLMMNL